MRQFNLLKAHAVLQAFKASEHEVHRAWQNIDGHVVHAHKPEIESHSIVHAPHPRLGLLVRVLRQVTSKAVQDAVHGSGLGEHECSHWVLASSHSPLQGWRAESHFSSHSCLPLSHALSHLFHLFGLFPQHPSASIAAMTGITGWGALSSAGRWPCPVTGESVARSPSAATKDPTARVEINRTLNRLFMVLEKGWYNLGWLQRQVKMSSWNGNGEELKMKEKELRGGHAPGLNNWEETASSYIRWRLKSPVELHSDQYQRTARETTMEFRPFPMKDRKR